MDYEIYGMDKKGNMNCYISCKASKVDKELERLVKAHPEVDKWLFGMHVHFRRFDERLNMVVVNWN